MMEDQGDKGASASPTGLSPSVEPASGLDGSATSIPCAGHTPWVADLHHEQRVGGRYYVNIIEPGSLVPVALVVTGVEGLDREEGRGRARLIAAAPELLEAAMQAETHLVELYRSIAPGSDGRFADEDVSVQMLRAAIAKATGAQS